MEQNPYESPQELSKPSSARPTIKPSKTGRRLIAAALLVALYATAYLANMTLDFDYAEPHMWRIPKYRVGGRFAEIAFAPAHWVDVMLRPALWAKWKPDPPPLW